MQALTFTVHGDLATSEGGLKEEGGGSRGRCRHGQVQGGLAPVEGAMEESGGLSRGMCRLVQVQGGSAPGERAIYYVHPPHTLHVKYHISQ